MIKIKLYYSIVTILFLISCVSNKGNDFLSIPAKPIYGSYYDKEIMSNELVAFSSLDCGILMVQRCKLPGEPICQILEEQTGERVGSFGSRGQGPGEFIAAEFIGKTEGDDTLYFVNLPSTVLLYAREEKGADYRYVGSEKIKVKDGCFTTRFCRLSNGYSVATTLSGGKEFFILFDRDFKEIKRFGNHPVRGMTTEANDFMQLQGEMVSYKNSFYFASRFFGYLCRYDISDEEDVTLKWEKMLVEPVCNVYEANLARKKNNLDGFYGLTANDKYVFVTYSGELCYKAFENYSACTPKTLQGFSIDGELVGKYALEHQSMSVLLSQYTPQLYLLNCESECNVEIFEMDDILKAKL